MRASVKTILHSSLLLCLALVSPLRADDTITEVMSPIASYVYCEWPGDDVLQLRTSPWVSYYYPGLDGPQIVLHGRVTGAGGAPLAGATVSAAWGTLPVASTSTAANGTYALPLGAGVYALTAGAPGYAPSARVLTLSAGTAPQDFQLNALPAAPDQLETVRSPVVNHSTGPPGELKMFDGVSFVAITGGNAPQLDRMTIVLTHGFNSNPEEWASGLAAQMRDAGVTAEVANILCWDWRAAAVPLAEAYGRTGDQGIALGGALQDRLGVGYFPELHFLGHSLGTLVNAAAINYLRGDKLGHEEVASAPWISKPIHVTLFDHAERANLLNQQLLYDGLSLNLVEAVDRLSSGGGYTWEWQRSLPVRPTWADNYVSLFGFGHAQAVNVRLKKSTLGPVNPHSYAWWWYGQSVENPTDALNPLGFGRSLEYLRAAGLSAAQFPPSAGEAPPGSWFEQSGWSSNPLALHRDLTVRESLGIMAETVVQGTVAAVQTAGQVLVEVREGAQAAGQWIAMGFNAVGNAAIQGGQSLVNLFDSAVLRLQLLTTSPSPSPVLPMRGGPVTAQGEGDSAPPMAWLPIAFPTNATAMAFDFIVEDDPVEDVLVCGIGTNHLFSLAAKYIPTNAISASPLVDVTAWAGTTNELFFGFLGGTSTEATLVIENIRFYSVAQPRLEIAVSGDATLLSWPLTAGGYVVEMTPMLSPPAWEIMTNAPAISADRYVLTNSWNGEARFYRLKK
ncbi:MAG: carboxypeptidase regulatory-like domain-containing protein [Verrucomicrobiae bacterium]|nr:carboxypeptidase regulatory-like domain-containing protein [Verrucomicrobiae bacterium]